MAYPNGTYSQSPVSNGQVIDAARDNAQDAELTAVTNGLLNGLQHGLTVSTGGLTVSTGSVNISGPSSLATLQVNGGSTFAGLVTFSSGITVSGPVNLNRPRVRVTIGADVGVPHNSFTGLNWNTQSYDTHAMHSTTTNSSRLTFVDSTGVYNVGAQIDANLNSSGALFLRIVVNDSTQTVVAAIGTNAIGGFSVPLNISADVRIGSTSDYATVQVFQNSGSTRSVTSTGQYVTAFWAHKVS